MWQVLLNDKSSCVFVYVRVCVRRRANQSFILLKVKDLGHLAVWRGFRHSVTRTLLCIKTCFYLFTTEPTSSTQAEACAGSGQEVEQDEREVPCGSQEEGSDMDQTEQQAPAGVLESPETSRDSEESNSDPVSSSSSSSGSSCSIEESAEAAREDIALTPSSSTTEAPTEGAMDSATLNTGTTEEPMEQD